MTKFFRTFLLFTSVSALVAGCSEPHSDLRAWMEQQGRDQYGKIDPIPPFQAYEPFEYNAYDLQDPFFPRKVGRATDDPKAPKPRPSQPLEAYPLESLTMVGTLSKEGVIYALIRVPNREIYQVGVGNYMGQNYGKIISISETEIQLNELVQDGAGDWSDRANSLRLVESDSK